jgi:hypothetical protein
MLRGINSSLQFALADAASARSCFWQPNPRISNVLGGVIPGIFSQWYKVAPSLQLTLSTHTAGSWRESCIFFVTSSAWQVRAWNLPVGCGAAFPEVAK